MRRAGWTGAAWRRCCRRRRAIARTAVAARRQAATANGGWVGRKAGTSRLQSRGTERGAGDTANPSLRTEGGVDSAGRAHRCLPFLSKVEHRPRARRPDFHLAIRRVVTVAGLCRTLTGFATPRQIEVARTMLPRALPPVDRQISGVLADRRLAFAVPLSPSSRPGPTAGGGPGVSVQRGGRHVAPAILSGSGHAAPARRPRRARRRRDRRRRSHSP